MIPGRSTELKRRAAELKPKSLQGKEEQILKGWLAKHYPAVVRSMVFLPLPGDASSRRYFRIRTRNNSMIAMKLDPFPDLGEQLPYLQVQKHLHKLSINVPQIIDLDPKQGIILLSDLGDETLLKRLERVSKKRDQLVWFKRAIDLLLDMQ